ncbi:receptor-like protein EIX1 [Prunus dulcis]|uniref:receptor-like protein EIX1 n=1 Tax=Prunus dulcis TaxID=3755 RepID=UPI001481D330|nr:receptor-like protein EIX1 [Prunus dulcis]
MLTLKGQELVYNTTLMLVKSIDLSSNFLEGEIPEEIGSLILLGTLNLWRNQLTGKFPSEVGNMHGLETLDLSNNRLSGQIPETLASLTFLAHLNLASNNLVGRIPSGNQLQTFTDLSIYMGNLSLCGVPLPRKCPEDDTFTATNAKPSNEDGSDKSWFYVSMVLGFVVGFWGVFGTLLVKKSWRTGISDSIPEESLLKLSSQLENLDLSYNHFRGHIPQSLSSLTFLSHLNLSYNNLVGRIPLGSQLQTLSDSSIYMDNPSLCGVPLPKCLGDDTFTATNAKHSNEDGNDNGALWFYVSMILGFIIGFWGVCGTLLLKKS